MQKKIFTFALSLCAAAFLCGCGGESSSIATTASETTTIQQMEDTGETSTQNMAISRAKYEIPDEVLDKLIAGFGTTKHEADSTISTKDMGLDSCSKESVDTIFKSIGKSVIYDAEKSEIKFARAAVVTISYTEEKISLDVREWLD